MTQINLLGLHHFDEIGTNKTLEADLKKPGVYIWGFLAKKLNGENSYEIIDTPIFRNGQENYLEVGNCFIPYYVGESKSTKSNSTIFTRLDMHHKPTKSHGTKYTRIVNGYFRGVITRNISFGGNNGDFKQALKSKKDPFNLIEQVIYNNDPEFLKIHLSNSYIRPVPKPSKDRKDNYPITLQNQNGGNFKDILQDYIVGKNNFYFLYANIEPEGTKDLEAFLYFLLKGYTIGEAKSLAKLSNIQYSIYTNSWFPHNSIFKDVVSDFFPGF